ncbi:MAG: AAA family ATPase [Gammaproteobacteria bacterium]|nr:AAA family ATPase [Gammaproteobacteria bacterium]
MRFICLATLLLQPVHMQPSTILIDQPELGIHPATITILAELLSAASEARQVIVATQSADLLSEMRPEDVVVTERCDGASAFRRLDLDQLAEWLSDTSLGDLWKMNTFGGRP